MTKQDSAVIASKKEDVISKIRNATSESNELISLLERNYISDSSHCSIVCRRNPDLDIDRTVWIKISQIGYNAEEKLDRYFSALRNIFKAFSMPDLRLLYLVLGRKGNYSLYLGLTSYRDDRVQVAIEMSDFIESSWSGTRCSVIRNPVKDDALMSYYNGRFKKSYALTGIPSLDINKEFPSTVENLMSGNSNGTFAYLVVADPIASKETNDIISICREKQGELETYKSANVNQSYQLGNAHGVINTEGGGVNAGGNAGVSIGGFFSVGGSVGSFTSNNSGTNDTESYNQSIAVGSNIVNKSIEAVISYLKKYEDRFESGKANGMWKIGCYLFLGEKADIADRQLKSLLSGEGSKYEPIRISNVSEWLNHDGGSNDTCDIIPFVNPPQLLVARNGKVVEHLFGKEYSELTTILTTNEMSAVVNFPIHSLPGVLVRDIPSFGRGVVGDNMIKNSTNKIELGRIVHQGKVDNSTLSISEELLTSHSFICGSTGSGKSNTIYYMLDNLSKRGKHFLIIEPAKGEYKDVFGGREDVYVFGTNPKIAPQLHLNIFAFPDSIHVEEHIDRLIDIFNACWPMYAAMPAVLKESICRAYKSCGWDLNNSENEFNYYPSIKDVIRELRNYVNESEYSTDSKGDYKGALETRLESLSNGIIGQVFSGTPISESNLFDKNVIVDLSRIGSIETKALLMGILVMKLNEYRMQQRFEGVIFANQPLTHITVLEEAHNLLKSTGQLQSQESSNILGKSVEMITSAIAEMRTFGEGFIIADQSPNMLDQAVISNTNTKIIMNLPNRIDRQISGDSISLNSRQQLEISKLETGRAVVFQKGWQEPILCQINRFSSHSQYKYVQPKSKKTDNSDSAIDRFLMNLYSIYAEGHKIRVEIVENYIDKTHINDSQKYYIKKKLKGSNYVSSDTAAEIFASYIGLELFEDLSKKFAKGSDLKGFNSQLEDNLCEFNDVIGNHLTYFVSMYVLGCSNISHLNFYNTWNVLNSEIK